jgi:prevent-host-death family protein
MDETMEPGLHRTKGHPALKTIELSEATASLTDYALAAQRSPVIVTKKGKPLAAVISLKDLDWEAVRLSLDDRFISIIERSRRRRKKEGGIPAAQVRRELGVK